MKKESLKSVEAVVEKEIKFAKDKLRAAQIECLRELALANLAAAAPKESKVKALSDIEKKVAKLEKYLSSTRDICADYKKVIANVCTILLGTDVTYKPAPTTYFMYKPGTCVVPVRNPNDHNYTCNKVCVCYKNDYALRADGSMGNHLPHLEDTIRLATEKEINAFYDALATKATSSFTKFASLIK